MDITTYPEHLQLLPAEGRHIVGRFTDKSVFVYQAFPKTIARVALKQQMFAPPFCLDRLSWIKTNFMWMMYRAEWGLAEDYVLAIEVRRSAFEDILCRAEHAQFAPHHYANTKEWRKLLRRSDVRIQWDPEHDPLGGRLPRKALQIGLSGDALKEYATRWILSIEDISDFVRQQRSAALSANYNALQVPKERVYQPQNASVRAKLLLAESAG